MISPYYTYVTVRGRYIMISSENSYCEIRTINNISCSIVSIIKEFNFTGRSNWKSSPMSIIHSKTNMAKRKGVL